MVINLGQGNSRNTRETPPQMTRKSLTREDLSKALNREIGLPGNESSRLIDDVLNHLATALDREGKVAMTNFGTFVVRHKKERIGRNPKTGEEAVIKARRSIVFRPSDKLRQRVSERSK
jgi:integration host factor subunit alpha